MRTVEAAGLPIGDGYPPRIMGVLNVSPESPYEPSVYNDPTEAAAYVEETLIADGAAIVDIGLESANKRFDVRSADWELDRLELAIEVIEAVDRDVVFSIETRYHEVADTALARGFGMVNDICGFADPQMPAVCAAHDAAVVKMASPPDLESPGALTDVDAIYDALARNGLTEKTIIDPAFGGWTEEKTLDDDREIFRRLREFRGLDHPMLVSINRKNFLRKLVDRSTEEALSVSLGATAMAVERGVHVIRTHDVQATADAAQIGWALADQRVCEGRVEELDVTTAREAARHTARLNVDEAVGMTGVARMFKVTDLTASEQESLATAAAGTETMVGGSNGTSLIAGTVGDLSTYADALEGSLRDVARLIDPRR